MMMFKSLSGSALLLSCALPSAASAAVPAATGYTYVASEGDIPPQLPLVDSHVDGQTAISTINVPGKFASATASVAGASETDNPYAMASLGAGSFYANAILDYYVRVSSSASEQISLNALFAGAISGNNPIYNYAAAQYGIYAVSPSGGRTALVQGGYSTSALSADSAFVDSRDFLVTTNVDYLVELIATVDGSTAPGIGAPQVNAMIDPFFSINGILNPASYTLQFSPGITNNPVTIAAAVPEPASWALMIAGFGLAGIAQRRRRTSLRSLPNPPVFPL